MNPGIFQRATQGSRILYTESGQLSCQLLLVIISSEVLFFSTSAKRGDGPEQINLKLYN